MLIGDEGGDIRVSGNIFAPGRDGTLVSVGFGDGITEKRLGSGEKRFQKSLPARTSVIASRRARTPS
jgi:hypothetical protein